MIAAYFMACVANTVTGGIECANSYTEMASVVGSGQTCEAQAKVLSQSAIDSVLIADLSLVEVARQYGCGTLEEVKAKAAKNHFDYQQKGIRSYLYEF